MNKTSPVWPPFPGCGYEGSYEPVIAEQMVAEQAAALARQKASHSSRTKASSQGSGWGTGTIRRLGRKRKGGAR